MPTLFRFRRFVRDHAVGLAGVAGLVLIVAVVLSVLLGRNEGSKADPPRQRITVGLALSQLRPISETVDGLGTCEAPLNRSAVLGGDRRLGAGNPGEARAGEGGPAGHPPRPHAGGDGPAAETGGVGNPPVGPGGPQPSGGPAGAGPSAAALAAAETEVALGGPGLNSTPSVRRSTGWSIGSPASWARRWPSTWCLAVGLPVGEVTSAQKSGGRRFAAGLRGRQRPRGPSRHRRRLPRSPRAERPSRRPLPAK